MRVQLRPWQITGLVLIFCTGVIALAAYLRLRGSSDAASLAAYLPQNRATLVHFDVSALRQSGLLELLAGSKAAEESEYRVFVEQSGFDYRQDLEALLASFSDGEALFLLRGRFDWKKLRQYVAVQKGSCWNGFCRAPGTAPDRYISFFALKSNVMALAVSGDEWAAVRLRGRKTPAPSVEIPAQPVWISVPAESLAGAPSLPAGVRAFVSAVEGAERLLFSFDASGGRFQASLQVTCQSPDHALKLANQLQQTTDLLRRLIARENKTPNPKDLSGVLTAGTFRHENRTVYGRWPLERAFLEAVAGGSL